MPLPVQEKDRNLAATAVPIDFPYFGWAEDGRLRGDLDKTSFAKALWKDFENALQKIEKEYDTDIDGAYGLLSLKFKDPKWHIVSDLFGGMSNNKAKGRYGHNNSYWKKPGALERGAFAHFFGTIARSDEEKFLLLYKYFPLSMDAFLEMLL